MAGNTRPLVCPRSVGQQFQTNQNFMYSPPFLQHQWDRGPVTPQAVSHLPYRPKLHHHLYRGGFLSVFFFSAHHNNTM